MADVIRVAGVCCALSFIGNSVVLPPESRAVNHAVIIPFLFALGACVGSFLNVVVWRLPRGKSLVSPPSHCPKCGTPLKWYDNLPVIGWIKLRGKCRFCSQPISARYPIVEAITGLLFVFYYVMFFIRQVGPEAPVPQLEWSVLSGMIGAVHRPLDFQSDYVIYFLYMFLVSSLLAASLIDAELFIIPLKIPLWLAGVGVLTHTLVDKPSLPGALSLAPHVSGMAIGGAIGLAISVALLELGKFPLSFPQSEPMMDVDRDTLLAEAEAMRKAGAPEAEIPLVPPPYTPHEIRLEMRKEMLFLLPPMILAGAGALLAWQGTTLGKHWASLAPQSGWIAGLAGSLLGALIGAFVVWIARILGTLVFGRVAMGLGDVHLMFGVGAIVGAGAATVAFFIAPVFGLLIAVYMLFTGKRRELPFGPYLSLATATGLLFYWPIADYLTPGLAGLAILIRQTLHLP